MEEKNTQDKEQEEKHEEAKETVKAEESKSEEKVEEKKDDTPKKDSNPKEKGNLLDKIKALSWQIKILIFGLPLLLLATLLLLITILKLDAYVFPSSITGQVTSIQGVSLEGATICVSDDCVISDGDGVYSLENLVYGNVTLTVELDDYDNLKAELRLKRGENKYDVQLDPSGVGNVEGMITSDDEDPFVDMKVYLDGEEVTLAEDGTFSSSNILVGTYNFSIETPNYVDYTVSVELEEGVNDLGEFTLVPAADIVFTPVDWLTDEKLDGISFDAGKLSVVNEGSEVFVKDIVIAELTSVAVVPSKEGYLDNEIVFKGIEQGLNEFGNTGIVREGRIVYTSNRTGDRNIYSSNYDGSDEILLSGNKGDNYDPYLTDDGKTVYFTSDRAGEKNTYGSIVGRLYKVSVNGGSVSKVSATDYHENNGYIGGVNYEALKRFYTDYAGGQEKIVLGNIDGTNLKDIVSSPVDNYSSLYLSDNGKYLLFSIYNYGDSVNESANGIYRVNTTNNAVDLIYENKDEDRAWTIAIHPSNNKVMIRRFEDESNRYDLWLMNIDGSGLTRITNSSANEDSASLSPNGSYAGYMSSRDGRTDVFINSVNTEEIKITSDGKVTNYFWGMDDLLFYNSENKLWVVDINNPGESEVVTENALGPYHYGYYYWE